MSIIEQQESYFHLHLVSDATGETLITVGRAASARYSPFSPVEHVYPLVRTQKQLDRAINEIETAPGIVLYTLVDRELSARLEQKCREFGVPCMSVLQPVLSLFQSYLGAETAAQVGAQHTLDAHYFKRIDAMNFTLMHDDGQIVDDLDQADVVLVGISRTSKTPTAIYLANRGIKAANVPLVPSIPPPAQLGTITNPLVVALIASPERISQIRQNRMLGLNAVHAADTYVDRQAIAEELAFTKKLAVRYNWPLIDVTRRSIEETAAAIVSLLNDRRRERLGHD